MKNKIILLVLVLFVVSSCGFGKKDEEIDKNLSSSVVEDNIISEKDGVVTKKEIVVENEIKDEEVTSGDKKINDKDIKEDENNYSKFEKLQIDKIISYDCNNFKSDDYIQRCTNYKNMRVSYFSLMKNSNTNEIKIKMLEEGNFTFCEEYLKTKDEEGYFNCSLAIIIANEKVKCSDIKNVGNFTKYFGKTCDEVVVRMNKYIEEKALEQEYEKMLKGFWGQDNIMNSYEDLEKVYLNKIIREKQEKELKESTVKTN